MSDCQCQDPACGQACDCKPDDAQVQAVQRAREEWERDFQAELERLQKRVADLEAQYRAHASRQICALMTEIDSLERNVLGRETTTAELKKAGMKAAGLDRST